MIVRNLGLTNILGLSNSSRRNVLLIIVLISVFGLFHYWTRTTDNVVTADDPTVLLGGVPGFLVFANVWYSNKRFHFYPEDLDSIPDRDKIFSGDVGVEVERREAIDLRPNTKHLSGTSFFLNDGADSGSWSYLNWYYHFAAEVLLGAFAAISSTNDSSVRGTRGLYPPPQVPSRLIIPWESNWKDNYGMNEMTASGVFGGNFIDKNQWEEMGSNDSWIYFEKVVIVDRYASHRHNPLANRWNKMALPAFALPHSTDLMLHARNAIHSSSTIYKWLRIIRRPKIVYIDRQASSRHLTPEGHQGLLDVLTDLQDTGVIRVVHAKLEEMSRSEQMKAVDGADVMIGVHGNGLTHMLWMPGGATIIEIFTPDSFLRDYQVVAEVLGHKHIAVWNDREYARSEWEQQAGELHPDYLHDGTAIPLDSTYIRQVLRDAIGS